MSGWWWIGGKMQPHETKEESVTRCFSRETQLVLPRNRFTLKAVIDYRWKDRAQEPRNIGCHMLAYTFTVELTTEELAFASENLDTAEYAKDGLLEFDRESLIKEGVIPPILAFYDYLFPER